MAVTLVGEVVNSCDSATGFSTGGISGDDDFVEGSGALGLKASNTTVELYTTSLGATAPYDFSNAGGESGYHAIMWFNTKTPVDPTTGLTIIMGNGTSRGRWNVLGSSFYKGGFVTRVIDTAADFDTIAAGSWSTTGNPAQLSNVTQMGGGFTTTTSIMGSFNNVQIDQITIGLGLRVDAGTIGTPNTFEAVRSQDEDASFWGWWSSVGGSVVGKGKLFIGPETGTATSVFDDTNFKVEFADEIVAVGFYEIDVRGSNTDVAWVLGSISAANPTNSRWSLTVDSTTNSFSDTNSVWSGGDVLSLNSNTTLVGTTIVNTNNIITNGATLDGVTGLSPSSTVFITASNLSELIGCTFESSGTGHAVDLGTITVSDTMSWDNSDTGYAATDGSTGNETILVSVNSGQTLTINVNAGASTPTIKNDGLGTVNVVAGQVTLNITVKDINDGSNLQDARVYVIADAGGSLAQGTVIIDKALTSASGLVTDTRSYSSNQPIIGRVRKATGTPYYKTAPITGTINNASGLDLTIQMIPD